MTNPSPIQKRLFLETTIQIERVIGAQQRRDTIKYNINGRSICTSGHVLSEYNKTLVRDATVFRNLLRSSTSVAEAIIRLGKYVIPHRKYQRTIELLAQLGFDKDKQNTLDRIEKFVEWQAHDIFWEYIDKTHYSDQVKCSLNEWRVARADNGDYTNFSDLKCLKESPPPCRVSVFINENRTILESFVTTAKTHKRENIVKASQAFEKILIGADTPFGERSNCYAISDTLIVLESPADAEMYSTDGDVHAICTILGKNSYTEISLQE